MNLIAFLWLQYLFMTDSKKAGERGELDSNSAIFIGNIFATMKRACIDNVGASAKFSLRMDARRIAEAGKIEAGRNCWESVT